MVQLGFRLNRGVTRRTTTVAGPLLAIAGIGFLSRRVSHPVYSPALVAFMPFGQNDIGWVPLGPGDVYVPHYYNNDWQPYYLTKDNLYQRGVNLNVPNAVTVVSVDDFTRGSDWRSARRADRNMLAQVNPVLDPLLLTPLRNAVIHSAWGRGKKDLPPGIAKKLRDTTVITSTTPVAPPFRPDLTRSMRVDTVSDRAKGQKFKVRDERGGRGTQQAAETSQQVRPPEQVQRDAGSQREAKRIEQEQRQQQNEQRRQENEQRRIDRAASAAQAERAAKSARQQAQGERVAAPQQQQRQQRPQAPQQQPQVRRDPGPVRSSQPAPPKAAPRAQPQQQPKQQRPPQAQKQDRPAKAEPAPGGGKGKGKKP